MKLFAGACFVLITVLWIPAPSAQDTSGFDLVPWPFALRFDGGHFELRNPVYIVTDNTDERIREIGSFLAEILRERTGFAVYVLSESDGSPSILLDADNDMPNPEAYSLVATPGGIHIRGTGSEGILWGVQTLRQLLPPEFEDLEGKRRDVWRIPAVTIFDEPRFHWRGSLMDVSRHFFPVEFVKRYIDLLSRYKMNVLHWHLTEDQAWRLEIDQYPRLTEVGAWRTEPDGSRYGGFYTKEEVRDVIEYARVRGVMVVPEIEIPGHSTAALVAYPKLACSGPPEAVPNDWGVFRDIYCVGKPETFTFLENVLDEVAELFPSPYIHIGGDEVPKDRWRDCEPCQEIIRREGLADEDELQAWFIRRIGEHLASRGKTLIGWDEILDGGGVPGSVVQVWRDQATVLEAAREGHDVIVSPTSHAYFDYSPAGLPLEQVYSFDPAPLSFTDEERAHVLGGEANLWSEYITTANFDLMAFPRLLAMSEALWSHGERDYDDFKQRLDNDQYARLRAMGVRPGPEDSDVVRLRVSTDSETGEPRVHVETSVEGLYVRYTTDATSPTASSPLVSDATAFVEGDRVVLGVFVGDEPLPIRREFSVVDHLARGKPITFEHPADSRYPGPSPSALTDGLLGSSDHRDGLSQGWWENDLVATIDLGELRAIERIIASFLNNLRAWIAPPEEVVVEFSTDGEHWRSSDPPAGITRLYLNGEDVTPDTETHWRVRVAEEARFIRITARQAQLPEDHPGAGHAAWLFADEIIVR